MQRTTPNTTQKQIRTDIEHTNIIVKLGQCCQFITSPPPDRVVMWYMIFASNILYIAYKWTLWSIKGLNKPPSWSHAICDRIPGKNESSTSIKWKIKYSYFIRIILAGLIPALSLLVLAEEHIPLLGSVTPDTSKWLSRQK